MNRKNNLPSFAFLFLGAAIFSALGFGIGRNSAEITPLSIDGAADLIGLSFTPQEKDSMIGTLTTHRTNFELMRKTTLANSVGPALVFNPLPQGFYPSQEQAAFDWGLPAKVALPTSDVDLAFMPVHQLAVLIKSRQVTSERLTQLYLQRIKTHSDTLACLVTLLEDQALIQARALDQELAAGKYRGPLHGIPYGIKDLFAVPGTRTTWGAPPYKDQVINETATIVTKLEKAGGVLVGKLTLGALAQGDVWFGGVTKNPWNLSQGSSGSSAGSASAVSAGLVPFAIGTETHGSIVSPSTRNGVTGLRPTFGRISRHGAMALSWSMDKVGPISRSALDNAIVLSVLNGSDTKDPSTIPAAFNYSVKKEVKKLKIGYFSSFFEGNRAGIENDRAVLELLKNQGITLQPVELKISINAAPLLSMLFVEGAAAFDDLTRLGLDDQMVAQHKSAWPNIFRAARFIPAVEYIQMSRQRSLLIEEMHALMKEYDVIITPSFAGQQLQITNLTGHPALCLPNGFGANGSPTSITLLANLFEEEKLIMVGRLIQENSDWQTKRPPLFNR
jgi:Asp-tRNA(Asn)/Glu-tRNA(Gln) amidotransferase A subunit family amidase